MQGFLHFYVFSVHFSLAVYIDSRCAVSSYWLFMGVARGARGGDERFFLLFFLRMS